MGDLPKIPQRVGLYNYFMRKLLLFSMLFIVSYAFADSKSEFDFYKSIPKYESISLNEKISIKIAGGYYVTVSGSSSANHTTSNITGRGNIVWDPNENSLYLVISGEVSGSYSDSQDIYTTERKYNVGSTTANLLFGSGTANTYTYERSYDHTEYYRASGSKQFSEKIPMSISSDGRYYTLGSRTLSATLTGDRTVTVSFSFGGEQHLISYGNTITSQNSTMDEFGRWTWNNDRSVIRLASTNFDYYQLYFCPSNQSTKLYLTFHGDKVNGVSATETSNGRLIQLSTSFEDGTNATLPFLEEKDEHTYRYVYSTYNRFTSEWNQDARSILNQIKEKQTLIVNVNRNNQPLAVIFELEGLEAILSYL